MLTAIQGRDTQFYTESQLEDRPEDSKMAIKLKFKQTLMKDLSDFMSMGLFSQLTMDYH